MKREQCIFSLESVEDSSQTSSSDTRQLSLLSGMPMPAKSSENEQQTDGFQDCQCGKEMSDCSIHPSTREKWIAFMQDSLARTLVSLESKQAYLREPDQVFTEKYCVSLAWYDQSNSSWRTYQQSFLTDSEPFLETWPRWGMTRAGSAYAHPMSERRITETDGFFWLTPTCMEMGTAGSGEAYLTETGTVRRKNKNGSSSALGLSHQVRYFPTPHKGLEKHGNGTNPKYFEKRILDGRQNDLSMEMFRQTGSGALTPQFVEWLMGFPIEYTVSKDWETRKSRSKQQQPTDCLEAE